MKLRIECLLLLLVISLNCFADLASVEAILQDPKRELRDKIRDSVRKPVQVLEFLGIQPGMKVLDLYAGGGYYTVVLSAAVGNQGHVFAQNSPRALRFEEDRSETTAEDALDAKLKALNIDNVTRLDQSFMDLDLESDSLDAAVVFLILHDYYNRSPGRAQAALVKLKQAVKPGGIIGIIDHHGLAGANNKRFHRMLKSQAIEAIDAAGLIVEADSELLAHPDDDRRRGIFDPRYNRHTDRFLLRVRVPAN